MDITLSAARAEASRRNGAKSRGPKTPEGKARSAKNALRHGLRAEKFVLLHDEDAAAFEAMADALADDLAPRGALQSLWARRLVVAAWRLERADRIERELFALRAERDERGLGRLGLALVRDGNGSRSFDTLLRYRGSAMAELWHPLRALKALQAEAPDEACEVHEDAPAPPAPPQDAPPIEPEARENPGEIEPAPPADESLSSRAACPAPPESAPCRPACVQAPAVKQKCATMAQKCVTYAPPV
jgi:hypothetical protein